MYDSDMLTFKIKFKTEQNLLNIIGTNIFLYPLIEPSNWTTFFGYYFLCTLVGLTVLQLFLTFVLTGFNSLVDFSNVSPNLGLCIMTLLKFIIIHRNKKFLNNFYKHYGEDLWMSIPENDQDVNQILDSYLFAAKLINRILLYYSLPLIAIVVSLPYMIMTYEKNILGKDLEHLYPFDGWYPFDKIKWYYAIYIWESAMTGLVIIIYMYSNLINLFIIVSMCMELRILGHNIKHLVTESDIEAIANKVDTSNTNGLIKSKLRHIVGRHNYVARICNDLDRMIGITLFGIYTVGSALMCLTAFTSTVAENSYQAIRCFCFFISLVMDAFYYCMTGQILSDHSIDLALDIYESQWIYVNQTTKKTLLILLRRVQQRFELTASGFVAMNLNTFTSIIGRAYRFFNLLRTVYEP